MARLHPLDYKTNEVASFATNRDLLPGQAENLNIAGNSAFQHLTISMQDSGHKNSIKEEPNSHLVSQQTSPSKRKIVKSRVYGIGKMTETCKEIN